MARCVLHGRGEDWTSDAWWREKEEDGGWVAATAAADGCARSESWWEGNAEFEMRRPLYGMCLWVEGERETGGVEG